jgi:hypothetical protein
MLIGLSLCCHVEASASRDSLHVPNVGNDSWLSRARCLGTVQIQYLPDMTPFEVPVSASASDASVSRRGIVRATSSHLRPEDAFLQSSPPYRSSSKNGTSDDRRKRDNRGNRNASRRRPRTWKKLLWVKQACMKHATERDAINPSPHTETFRSRQLHG